MTFYSQISANKRSSVFLTIAVAGLLGLLGFVDRLRADRDGDRRPGRDAHRGRHRQAVCHRRRTSPATSSSWRPRRPRRSTRTSAPQLVNVVQELTIAAGIPMPRVYVIDDTAPNAFATGRDPEHASIAVTTGLLQKMDREELQGVHRSRALAHPQLRHPVHAARRRPRRRRRPAVDFFLRYTFWFGGGRKSRDDSGGGGGLQIVFFVLAIVLAVVAPIAARFVQLAVSRQREYLADASSVELTRNPHGLERALATIASDKEVLEVASGATQHLYFTNPIKKFEKRSAGLFSTHPPIVDRINRLRSLTGEQPLDPADQAALTGLD